MFPGGRSALTSTPADRAGRAWVSGPSAGPASAPSATPALVMLLLGGLALRLTIAYVLFPGSGFESDTGAYASWALSMAEHGPSGFYGNVSFIDYPPGYLYVLWPIGLIAQAFGGADSYGLAGALTKVPPILIDIAVSWLLYRLVVGWAWPGR